MKNHDETSSLDPLLAPGKKIHASSVDKRIVFLSFQAIINALIIGFFAKGLVYLLDLVTNISFYGRFSFKPASPAHNNLGVFVIAIPIIGGLIVGFIARYGSKAIRGHGIPEAMEKIILENSKIPPLITLLKPLSAAIAIGTGGPFGAEGPIIATGGAFGSFTGQLMHISANERKILLSAGACAGMAAIFGSPLSAVLLAIELLLFEFSPRSIIPVTLACIAGDGMHIWLFGQAPAFAMGVIPLPSDGALLVYTCMGLLIGVIASFVSKSVYAVEDMFEQLPIHWMWWPAIGAIAVGVVGYYAPLTLGVGYENIQHLLDGKLTITTLLSLCVLKYISWVISLGSGTSGGTLAPLFTIGGALGALMGLVILKLFPGSGITLATAALIGMASMFAGASRALLTSIVFALEITGQPNGLLPILGACIAAYFVSFFLMKGSIMTEKIRRRGVTAPHSYEPDLLRHTTAKDIMITEVRHTNIPHSVKATDDLSLCLQLIGKHSINELLVTDEAGNIMGMLTAESLIKYYSDQKLAESRYEAPLTGKLMGRLFKPL